jgi:hypothetical protein
MITKVLVLLLIGSPVFAGVSRSNLKQCYDFVRGQKQTAASIMENRFDEILKNCGNDSKFYLEPKTNVFFGQLDGKEMRKITDKWASSCNKQKDMKACIEGVNRKMTYLRIVNGGIAGLNSKESREPADSRAKTRNVASSRKKK